MARHRGRGSHSLAEESRGRQPLEPVRGGQRGVLVPSVRELLAHRIQMNRIFGLEETAVVATGYHEPAAPETGETAPPEHLPLPAFLERLVAHAG